MKSYDVIVIGGGHAGIEAALASARLGVRTLLYSISLDQIANMPCNPSIGGTAKGHLVREIDALGGEMAKAADETFLQSRMLNTGKGPAVYSLRVQTDRMHYHQTMKARLEEQPNLMIKQGEVVSLGVESGRVTSVTTRAGQAYQATAVILCCGTYLNGMIHVGKTAYRGGPDGVFPSEALAKNLKALGLSFRRFKTGTPARVHRRSIDFSKLEEQRGDEPVIPFSFDTKGKLTNRSVCHIAYTNQKTHQVIRENLEKSPLYSGLIHGAGPRYCPSIEDKVVRFADKTRHQVFVEPMGLHTQEMYLQGLSTSLPEEAQIEFLRTISGFQDVEILRCGYAIEYDCCDPMSLYPTLEHKKIKGLYGAGQFNGSSGYEEAAAQGIVAGINAARSVKGEKPLILERSGSYIGTLIDDLVTRGCTDPYRMMTSRSEHRLLLRQDNADQRLTPIGYQIGLISERRYQEFSEKQSRIAQELKRVQGVFIPMSEEANLVLVSRGTTPTTKPTRFSELLRRPQLHYNDLKPLDKEAPDDIPQQVAQQVEILLKYQGYIEKQEKKAQDSKRMEERKLPTLDYTKMEGLRLEAREKLQQIQPKTLGQASRISGVNPADITALLILLEKKHDK